MTTTISSADAKQNWDAIITAATAGDEVIVETDGAPRVIMISPETYQELQNLRENQRRAEILARLEALQQRQAERNKDLTDEQIEELANRASHEIFDELAAEGKLTFERDQQ